MKTEEMYRWVKTAGMLSIIPIVLSAGPLSGYLVADLLIGKFGFPGYTTIICVIIGFAAGVKETVRIIKIALKAKE